MIIFRPWRRQYSMRSGTRAMVPSSFMTSQMTAAGCRPARRARSTPASVCPARSSTPPGWAMSGKTWPGWTRSCGPHSGSTATWMVRARSAAEMPVVTPSRASIDCVKAVWKRAEFCATIGPRLSSSQRRGVSARQIRPRPWVAMKLIASGVTNWAAMVRSPSFSRSSSSHTTTMRPARMSASASSIVANGDGSRTAPAGASSRSRRDGRRRTLGRGRLGAAHRNPASDSFSKVRPWADPGRAR